MKWEQLKRKYIGLDLIRVASALAVCMFHTRVHLACDYGPLLNFSKMGAVFMTAFFMLSGFSLFVNWAECKLNEISNCKKFWKKRFFGIIPMYWLVSLLYVIVMFTYGEEAIFRTIALAPVEVLGLQSSFSSLFNVSHNGGTWFVSCILICYVIYPMLQELIKGITKKTRIILLLLCCFALLYSPLVVHLFELNNIYSNPFFRLLEFFIGMILASMKLDFETCEFVKKYIYNWWTIVIVNIIMIIGISIAVALNIGIGDYMLYSWICLPCFMIILLGLSGVESKLLEKSKFVKWMSAISYVFFLAQLFSNRISKKIIEVWDIESNIIKIMIAWGVCFAIAICFRFVEVRIKKILKC